MNEHANQALLERFKNVKERIEQACKINQRQPDSVSLLAVSKTKPIAMIETLAHHKQIAFGENYLQEALQKIQHRPDLEWHFIGPIQSNKTKPIAQNFAWVQSIDRLKIAKRLSEQRPPDKPPLNVLLEVNISQQASKAGLSPAEVFDIAPQIALLPQLKLRGLMAIPQPSEDFSAQQKPFRQLRELLEKLNQEHPDWHLDTLSMGMSADLEAAISEGATMVRIGSDIFGART